MHALFIRNSTTIAQVHFGQYNYLLHLVIFLKEHPHILFIETFISI